MINPFSQLKRYSVGKNDPQENHATECLAACLVFSPRICHAFIEFLLNEESKNFDASEIEVETQVSVGGGYIDLVLRQESKFIIAVEVKVKSPENCVHHQTQLQNYRQWLDMQNEPRKLLFTLVRNEDNGFRPQDFGVKGRRTWRSLHKRLKDKLKPPDLPEAEYRLIENFCNYLESEAIVSTYKIKDLLSYAEGLKARKAVTGIFSQTAARLEADGFIINPIEDKKDHWPRLQIQRPEWERIFGKGHNWKINLWFCVPGIWEADQYEFSPEIDLWRKEHGNDWQFIKSKLHNWFSVLKSADFNCTVWQTWNKGSENVPAQEIQNEPKRISLYACKAGDSIILDENQLQNENDLIKLLVDRIKQYSKVVDSLGT